MRIGISRTSVFVAATLLSLAARAFAADAPTPSTAPDASTPKGALTAFVAAMAKPDAAAAKEMTAGAPDDLKIVECYAAAGAAQKKLHEAAEKKFGKDEITTGANGPAAADRFKDVDKWEEKIDGDKATLTRPPDAAPATIARRPGTSRAQAIQLKKIDGKWKLSLASMVQPDRREIFFNLLDAVAKANNDTADEIASGKYETSVDAKNARNMKLAGAMKSANPNAVPK